MDSNTPIDGDAVVNHLLGRIASLERELALMAGQLGAVNSMLAEFVNTPHDEEAKA